MPIITPPFRTSLLMANGIPFGTGNGDIQTTRDWWLYWSQLGDQTNAHSKLATEGTHADRPVPESMPDGALYYESDRGVLYSNANGHWQYVAGTMFGTLSPDQRPTDLGTHDAGFDFRGTDEPREFLWSQTEWIEVTAVQYGTHAARPDPATIVEGALYVESDRGGVIYQRETPAGTPLWQYLAGTMWGTLVPDQRPTDLGTHDAGFDFRTTVAPPREFIWNQVAWVEITALVDPTTTKGDLIARGVAAPATRLAVGADGQVLTADSTQALGVKWGAALAGDVQIAYASASTTLTTAPQDLGITLTLNRAGRYYLNGVFDLRGIGAGDVGALLIGQLVADGAVQPKLGFLALAAANNAGSVSQQWVYTASAAGKIVKLQAYKTGGTGTSAASGEATLTALWVSN